MSRVGKETQKKIDAIAPLTIKVGARDAKSGIIGDPRNCAIARALKRQGVAQNVAVGASIVYVERADGVWVRYQLKSEDKKMIQAFDQLRYFRPGTYELQPPAPSKRIGARRGKPSGSNTRGTGKSVQATRKTPTRVVCTPTIGG